MADTRYFGDSQFAFTPSGRVYVAPRTPVNGDGMTLCIAGAYLPADKAPVLSKIITTVLSRTDIQDKVLRIRTLFGQEGTYNQAGGVMVYVTQDEAGVLACQQEPISRRMPPFEDGLARRIVQLPPQSEAQAGTATKGNVSALEEAAAAAKAFKETKSNRSAHVIGRKN